MTNHRSNNCLLEFDLDGNVLDTIFFGPKYIDINTNQFVPSMDPKVVLNIKREKYSYFCAL